MKFTKEERLEVGRKIHESGLSNLKAAKVFGISEESARRYRLQYKAANNIEHITSKARKNDGDVLPALNYMEPASTHEDYAAMSKEELIEELMKSKVREARLKKGYIVKGVGVNKEYIPLDSKNIK